MANNKGLTRAGDVLADMLPELAQEPTKPTRPTKTASISKRMERRLDGIEHIQLARTDKTQDVGYLARPFVLCALPFKPIKGATTYKRRYFDHVLEITASAEFGLPFGADLLPVIWVSTLAKRQMVDGKCPRVISFRSGAEFLNAFGLPLNGQTYKRAQEKFLRVFYSTYFYGKEREKGRSRIMSFRYFDALDLWFTKDLNTAPLPGADFRNNTIVLSEAFAKEIEHNPPPLDLAMVSTWADKPAVLFFGIWLTYRCFTATGPLKIPLMGPGGLCEQCGITGYTGKKGVRNFRLKVKHWLECVKECWPECPARIVTDDPERADYLLIERRVLAIHPREQKQVTP